MAQRLRWLMKDERKEEEPKKVVVVGWRGLDPTLGKLLVLAIAIPWLCYVIGNINLLSKSVAFTSLAVKGIETLFKQNKKQRNSNQQFYTAIRLSGLGARAATNAATNIQRCGGEAGDMLANRWKAPGNALSSRP